MKTLLTLFVIFFSFSVFGGTIIGGVALDCASLQKTYDNNDKVLLNQYRQAVLGYISGLNVAKNTDAGWDVNEDTIMQVAVNYCKNNPLKKVADGAHYAYDQLL